MSLSVLTRLSIRNKIAKSMLKRLILRPQRDRVENDGDQSKREYDNGEVEQCLPRVKLVNAGDGAFERRIVLVLDGRTLVSLHRVRSKCAVDECRRLVELVEFHVA